MGARHIGVGAETTVGTAVAPTRFFEAIRESIRDVPSFKELAVLRAYSAVQIAELTRLVEGDCEIYGNYDGVGILFKNLIGSVQTTTGAVNTHTFPHTTTGIPSTDRIGLGLTLEARRDSALVWTYKGCKATALTHTFSLDDAATLAFSFIGMSHSTGTAPTAPTFSSFQPMLPSEITVNLTGGSGANLKAQSCAITVQNPLDRPFVLGSKVLTVEPDRSDVIRVTATIEALFESFAEYDKFVAWSDIDAQIRSVKGTRSMTYNLNKCKLTQATPPMEGRDRLAVTYELVSYHDTTSTENIQVVMENADATA